MDDKGSPTFLKVYYTPIGQLVALSMAELEKLRQEVTAEARRASLARRWIEGAIAKKSRDQDAAPVGS